MNNFYEDTLFVCNCHLPDHCFIIRQFDWGDDNDPDLPEISFNIGLTTYKNIFKRIWAALKYIINPKSNCHLFDEILLKEEDLDKIINILQKHKEKLNNYKNGISQ